MSADEARVIAVGNSKRPHEAAGDSSGAESIKERSDHLREAAGNPSDVELIKERSDYLRGTIAAGLRDPITGAVADADTHVLKFHGVYQYDDRDRRQDRLARKLEPGYSFMVRTRIPGGCLSAAQWAQLDDVSSYYADNTLRITTRQTLQFHGVIKFRLQQTLRDINACMVDTLAACGDVNRNVICCPDPTLSPVHREVLPWARALSEHLLPQSRAYHEIWLGEGRRVAGSGNGKDVEPLYGKRYLPRKFKIAIAIPPVNDTDVFGNDVGLIAITHQRRLLGFNVCVGGGFGMTFGVAETYPRLADVIGFCKPQQLLDVVHHIVAIQRDHGDRSDRRQARLKYTIARLGLAWFREALRRRLGFELAAPKKFAFTHSGDRYGWHTSGDKQWSLLLYVENGRLRNEAKQCLKASLREIADLGVCDFRLTPNQNVMLVNVAEQDKPRIIGLLDRFGVSKNIGRVSPLRKNALACVALNTCEHAMAEAERYLPAFLDKLESLLAICGLQDEPIKVRMTGCPNGCARPYLAEIGLIGKSVGRYNLYLGAGFNGDRLNRLYRENLNEAEILEALRPLLEDYAKNRKDGEHFGDFTLRAGYIEPGRSGREFHAPKTAADRPRGRTPSSQPAAHHAL